MLCRSESGIRYCRQRIAIKKKKEGICEEIIGRIRIVYVETKARVKVGKCMSEDFWIVKGLGHSGNGGSL